ncbi:MAG: gamma-glutamyl-gamma-aminobutyrate hydrolase family protein [Deltaproteobacteria bacterium]|nr:gamma-glutamyl-gamma-aminobutyrate hydrolase family protein [Deltaproteobacteria bacterium]
MNAVVLTHVAMEGPARLTLAAERAGLAVHTVKLFAGEPVPQVALDDVLVVMGGPMGVADIGDARYPFLASEVALLAERINTNAPTLGVCLGAQLLAHAAGARVYPNTRMVNGQPVPLLEVGWAPVRFASLENEPVLQGLPEQQTVLHWHGDTFDLPARGVALASTPLCRNQAFRLGTRLFGLQFHCEADPQTVHVWTEEDAAFVHKALGPQGPAEVLAQTAALSKADREHNDRLLDNLLRCMLA